jgi:hypothetical protein
MLFVSLFTAISFNQPNFCPSTTWNMMGITKGNVSIVGIEPYGLFIDKSNTLYVANRERHMIQIWPEGYAAPIKNISGGLTQPLSVFVTATGDIYADNGVANLRVDRWLANATSSTIIMSIAEECYSIFIDVSNNLYCAATFAHRVVKKWIGDNVTTSTIIAGTGAAGSSAQMLYYPAGVFVDVNLNIYVGDCGNDRIQLFPWGKTDGITVAGDGAPNTVTLDCPNAVVLDANGYMFITDNYKHRLFGSGPLGFRCLFGCASIIGSNPDQLATPRVFAFDSYGNIFVADQLNHRIQQFVLVSNSCST